MKFTFNSDSYYGDLYLYATFGYSYTFINLIPESETFTDTKKLQYYDNQVYAWSSSHIVGIPLRVLQQYLERELDDLAKWQRA